MKILIRGDILASGTVSSPVRSLLIGGLGSDSSSKDDDNDISLISLSSGIILFVNEYLFYNYAFIMSWCTLILLIVDIIFIKEFLVTLRDTKVLRR